MNWKTVFCIVLLAFPFALAAQTDVALDSELGGRMTVSMDKKIIKGLHLTLEEEARMNNNFSDFNRLQTTAGLQYKILPNIKIGFSYALITPYNNTDNCFKTPRHRFMLDASGSLHFDDWQLSLRERLQLTHRTGEFNIYQNPANLIHLKSRLVLKYKGLRRLTPYAGIEVRHFLNAPVINAQYNGSVYLTEDYTVKGEPGWFLEGFNGCYANRFRASLGTEYRLDKRNKIEACLLLDYVNDKVVDANAEGTKLKRYTRERGFVGQFCLSYNYSF